MQSMDSYRYLIAGRLTLKRAGGSAIFNFLSVASKKGTFSGGVNAPDQTQVTFLCYIHWKTYSIICIQRCKSSASEKVIIWRSWGSGNSSRGYLELHLLHFLEGDAWKVYWRQQCLYDTLTGACWYPHWGKCIPTRTESDLIWGSLLTI